MTEYRRPVCALAALSLAEIGFRMLTPWPMQAMIDYALGSQQAPAWLQAQSKQRLLITIIAAGLLIQASHHVIMMVHTRLQEAVSHRMICDLRKRMFAHLQGLTLTEHSRMPRGDSVYRLETDAQCVNQLIFGGLFPVTFSVVTLIAMFGILLRINFRLAVASMLVVPPLYLWVRGYTRMIRPRVHRTKELESRLTEHMFESFASIRLIKAFAREPFEQMRFGVIATEAMEANIELGRSHSVFAAVIAILTVLGNAAVLMVGGLAVVNGALTVGNLLVAVAYLGYVYGPLTAIAHTAGNLQRALPSAQRVREIFDLMPEDRAVPGSIGGAQKLTGAVRFEDVSFHYEDGRPVLKNVSFTAAPGETIALVGPSGAGKTTMLSLIPRFYNPSSGRILLDGVDSREYDLRALREQIAVVLQEAVIMSGSVRHNLHYGRLNVSEEEIIAASTAANAHEFINRLPERYSTDLGQAGVRLSGGQRQRLSIARAFLKNAPILILDEPTSALDSLSEALVLEALKRLRADRTTFVIAHRLSTIREADRILVVDAGEIVGEGSHEQLRRTSALYRELCRQIRDADKTAESPELASLAGHSP